MTEKIPEWIRILRKRVEADGKAVVASTLGYSSSAISYVLANSYKARAENIAQRVMEVYGCEAWSSHTDPLVLRCYRCMNLRTVWTMINDRPLCQTCAHIVRENQRSHLDNAKLPYPRKGGMPQKAATAPSQSAKIKRNTSTTQVQHKPAASAKKAAAIPKQCLSVDRLPNQNKTVEEIITESRLTQRQAERWKAQQLWKEQNCQA